MPRTQNFHRVLSRPMRVRWGGWETTTTQLQQGGWELAVHEDFSRMTIRMTMRHQGFRMYGVSRYLDFNFMRYANAESDLSQYIIEIEQMGTNIIIQMMEMGDPFAGMKAIDAYPQFTTRTIKRIEDYGFFATPLVRTQELIVDPSEIGRVLELIKQAQLPEQEAIRKRQQMQASRAGLDLTAIPQQTFHAQLLSVA
mgnify:CR=1 FL=1